MTRPDCVELLFLEAFDKTKDFANGPDLADLRRQLADIPGFDQVELAPRGRSMVAATLRVRNKWEQDQLRSAAHQQLHGWQLVDSDGSYNLPRTF